MVNKTNNYVIIIDFGSQVTQLIARRVREIGIYCEVHNHKNFSLSNFENKPMALIFSGGPESVYEYNELTITKDIFSYNIPILGICFGQQLICHLHDGKVEKSSKREYGHAELKITKKSELFEDITNCNVWMSHGDKITQIGTNFEILATTNNSPFAAFADIKNKIYGLQFHPEVYHTFEGTKIIRNFLVNIANCQCDWTMKKFIKEELTEIKSQLSTDNVICGLSGGVDSSVVGALINKAAHDQLTCIFVDHGLLRKNEAQEVIDTFTKNINANFIYVDAKKYFLDKLKDISDPEQKRKVIGKSFIDIFDQEASKIKDVKFLAQGTLYPDVIESLHPNSGNSQTIKSHHNVGGLPKDMKLKLVEPLRSLFKDEVRKLGSELGLPDKIVNRHPFPGPGLAIRIIGNITQEKITTLQEADHIFISEIRKANLYDKIWQAFCVLLPGKTVGVMGDKSTYENVLALRAVTSVDGMTADIYHFESSFLAMVSNKIINEVPGINRVVYDFTSKPPGTIEWE